MADTERDYMTAKVTQLKPKRIRRMMTQAEFDAFRQRESVQPTPVAVSQSNRGYVALAADCLGVSEFDLMNQVIAQYIQPIADEYVANWNGGNSTEAR